MKTELKTYPVRDFIDLCDTPSSYTGHANKMLVVNAGEDAVVFSPAPSGVTSVTATSPITSSGGLTPNISTSMSTNRLLGRSTAGTGVAEQITLGTGLSFAGTTLNASSLTTSTFAQVLVNGRDVDSFGVINDFASISAIEVNARRLFGAWTSSVSLTTPILNLTGSTSGTISIKPKSIGGTWTLTLPDNDGNNLQFLQTNGSGVTSWATPSTITTSTLAEVLINGSDADAVGVINDDSGLSSIEINGRRLNSSTLDNYINWDTGEVFTGIGATQIKANLYNGELNDGANETVDWINRTLSFGNWTSIVSHTTPILIMESTSTRHQSPFLADDATYTLLKSGAAGKVTVMCYENTGVASIDGFIQFVYVAYPSSGVGALTQIAVTDAINAATADTDGFLCAYMTGENVTIKNRLGSSRNIMILLEYF